MRRARFILFIGVSSIASAQPPGKFPPDSLINTKVIPHSTPVMEVVGSMRNFTSALGVRCQFCHVGREGQPLAEFDFASDQKRNKLVARHMMRMVAEINHRLDTIPERGKPPVTATCMTCHRGVSRPIPLSALVQDVTVTAGVDSAVRAYKALRTRYYGRDAYDFSEPSLSIAAFRTAQAGKPDEGWRCCATTRSCFPIHRRWPSSRATFN